LGLTLPVEHYEPSTRPYYSRLAAVQYDADWITRKVYHNGCIWWDGQLVFLTEALANEYVALRPLPVEPYFTVRFASEDVAFLDAAKKTVLAKLPRKAKLAMAKNNSETAQKNE
jgi:hypothetical protein